MKPLQISADTALKLSKALGVPLEHLMHMPQHILLKKLAELADQEKAHQANLEPEQSSDSRETKQ